METQNVGREKTVRDERKTGNEQSGKSMESSPMMSCDL